jgi:para-nitrobenzyl esterase
MNPAARSFALALTVACLGACSSSSSSPGANPSNNDAGEPPDSGTSTSSLDVSTDKGMVHGATAGGVRSFLGIPFAATTGGDNRWKPPQPAAPWTTTLKATTLGPICPQIDPSTMVYATTSDENCLSLNVWTPDPAPTKPLPVMVWIFGGAFVFGSGGAAPYSGNNLVPKGDVVLVSMNYRVGPLGFLTHSALAAEDPSHSTGNYGLLDQQAALKWVQTNIAAFGGDKSNVTIFGESAGGKSVCLQLLSPGSKGLFNKAIIESGLCLVPGMTLAPAEAEGDRFAQAMGCAGADSGTALSCLRGLSPTALTNGPANAPAPLPGGLFYQDSSTTLSFQPIVDGVFLTDQPLALFTANKEAAVPVLQGTNTNEGILFQIPALGPYVSVTTQADYLAALTRTFGSSSAGAIAARYPVAGEDAGAPSGDAGAAGGDAEAGSLDAGAGSPMTFATPDAALTRISSDALFVCPARGLERLLSANALKTYLYSFNGPLTGVPVPQLVGQAFHSSELPYVFGNSFLLGSVPDAGLPLVSAMEDYWTQFATTGDPNGGSNPMWPAYDTAGDQNIDLDTTITVGSGLDKANCDFWDGIVASGGVAAL